MICEEALLAEIGRASFVIPANGRTTMDVGAGLQPAGLVANQVAFNLPLLMSRDVLGAGKMVRT